MLAFVKAALTNLPVVEAYIHRRGGAGPFPIVPLVDASYALYAAPRVAIEAHYQSLDAFTAAWDTAETIGGLEVFTRGQGIVNQHEFWRKSLPKHGMLAHAVKPGRVYYRAVLGHADWSGARAAPAL